jgi:hypothetical protein
MFTLSDMLKNVQTEVTFCGISNQKITLAK